MSRSGRRVELAPAYLLHHRPWRDTSRLLEVFSRDHGRLALFARGVRGPKSKLAPVLQPFQPLLLSWSGHGDPGQLTRAESRIEPGRDIPSSLPPAALMSGWYLSELLLKLTTRLDPQPGLYAAYEAALAALRSGAPLPAVLRRFELQLLEQLGYGLDLRHDAASGQRVEPGSYYHFHASLGFVAISSEPGPQAVAGASLLALAAGRFEAPQVLDDARRVLRAALDHLLEGRELRTRAVAQAVARRPRRGGVAGSGTDGNGIAS